MSELLNLANLYFNENDQTHTPEPAVGMDMIRAINADINNNISNGAAGLSYILIADSVTPTSGTFKFNNVDIAQATRFSIFNSTISGADVSDVLDSWASSDNENKGRLYASSSHKDKAGVQVIFDIIGDPIITGDIYDFPITIMAILEVDDLDIGDPYGLLFIQAGFSDESVAKRVFDFTDVTKHSEIATVLTSITPQHRTIDANGNNALTALNTATARLSIHGLSLLGGTALQSSDPQSFAGSSAWTRTRVTWNSTDTVVGPGGNGVYNLHANATANTHYVLQPVALQADGEYTILLRAKDGGVPSFAMSVTLSEGQHFARFDPTTGSVEQAIGVNQAEDIRVITNASGFTYYALRFKCLSLQTAYLQLTYYDTGAVGSFAGGQTHGLYVDVFEIVAGGDFPGIMLDGDPALLGDTHSYSLNIKNAATIISDRSRAKADSVVQGIDDGTEANYLREIVDSNGNTAAVMVSGGVEIARATASGAVGGLYHSIFTRTAVEIWKNEVLVDTQNHSGPFPVGLGTGRIGSNSAYLTQTTQPNCTLRDASMVAAVRRPSNGVVFSNEFGPIVCMGDSYTDPNPNPTLYPLGQNDPWPARLATEYNTVAHNLGISGHSTTEMVARLNDAYELNPKTVVIYGGANDGVGTTSVLAGATTTVFTVDNVNPSGGAAPMNKYAIGGFVDVGGEIRKISAISGAQITVDTAFTSAPAANTAVTIPTVHNLKYMVAQFKARGAERVAIMGQHYRNLPGSDPAAVDIYNINTSTGSQVPGQLTLRNEQKQAADESCAVFVDNYKFFVDLLIAGEHVQGDFEIHPSNVDPHLDIAGHEYVADSAISAFKQAGWDGGVSTNLDSNAATGTPVPDGVTTQQLSDSSVRKVGVNAVATDNKRFASSSNEVLFDHDGGDSVVRVNKAATNNTSSLQLETTEVPRARIGLTGNNDLHVQVSQDGSTFHEAITVDNQNGEVSFPNSKVGQVKSTILTSGSGTYVVPDGVVSLKVTCVGGGGGGAGGETTATTKFIGCPGGSAGGTCVKYISSPAASYSYSVGSAGGAGSAPSPHAEGDASGGGGGTSTFSSANVSLSASGGGGGVHRLETTGITEYSAGTQSTATGGDLNISGGRGGGITVFEGRYQMGSGSGGDSLHGLGGMYRNGSGLAGTGYGSGGAGAGMLPGYVLNRPGGAGRSGMILIEEYY